MPNYSLLFAFSAQSAIDAAVTGWRWDYIGELHQEFRRPDTMERIRFVVDDGGRTLQGLRWLTKVYLVPDWVKRRDASCIMGLLDAGLFKLSDPELPPPRPRRKRDEALTEVRQILARLEQT